MRDIFVDNLLKFAVKDKNIFFLTADLGFGSFDVLERKLKDRYINVGVSEQNMIGIAAGLAREKKKVITYSIANFAFMRCLEQIRNDAAYHDCNVTIIANGAGFSYGQLGMSHHATEDIAIMSSIPNVKVHSPATKNDIEYLLKNSLKSDCVNYLRLDKSIYENNLNYKFNEKKCVTYYKGYDAHIFVTGSIASLAQEVLENLRKFKINCGMSVIHTLKPICEKDIIRITKKYKKIIILEEHNKFGGLSFIISEILIRNNIHPKKFISFNSGEKFTSIVGSQNYLRNVHNLNLKDITKKILKHI
jgi:transketolase